MAGRRKRRMAMVAGTAILRHKIPCGNYFGSRQAGADVLYAAAFVGACIYVVAQCSGAGWRERTVADVTGCGEAKRKPWCFSQGQLRQRLLRSEAILRRQPHRTPLHILDILWDHT